MLHATGDYVGFRILLGNDDVVYSLLKVFLGNQQAYCSGNQILPLEKYA